jgi:hypothetical protein
MEGTDTIKKKTILLFLFLFIFLILLFFCLSLYFLNEIFCYSIYLNLKLPIILSSLQKSESNKRKRDDKGRFLKSDPTMPSEKIPLDPKLEEALVGEMLGDGHLRFTHKDKEGNASGNVHFAMTLKLYEYTMYL